MRAIASAFCLLGIVALLSGCASSREPQRASEDRILYATSPGPFCGRCDSLKLTVWPDGRVSVERGHWAGRYTDWRVSRKSLKATPEQAALFRQLLAPYRPAGAVRFDGPPHCATLTDDLPGVGVTWLEARREDHLEFSFGCDTETRSLVVEVLRGAPALLGVESPLVSQPRAADVVVLERLVRLPRGASDLRDYARYYTSDVAGGRTTLIGSYLLNAPDAPGRYMRPAPVEVSDGGCAVVTIHFDVASRRVTEVYCNGVA